MSEGKGEPKTTAPTNRIGHSLNGEPKIWDESDQQRPNGNPVAIYDGCTDSINNNEREDNNGSNTEEVVSTTPPK